MRYYYSGGGAGDASVRRGTGVASGKGVSVGGTRGADGRARPDLRCCRRSRPASPSPTPWMSGPSPPTGCWPTAPDGHWGYLSRRTAGHFFLQSGRAQRAVQEPGRDEIQGRDGGVGDRVQQPDLPRGGVCGHQRGRLAGFAGEHDGESGVLCFTNKGDGTFVDCSESAGTLSKYGAMTMALADIDGNGTLDLYVANYRVEDSRDRAEFDKIDIFNVNGQFDRGSGAAGPLHLHQWESPGVRRTRLGLSQRREGAFHAAVLDQRGISGRRRPAPDRPAAGLESMTAAFRDLNGDGAPDIYVCNDYWTPDRFWLNDGKGHFQACPGWRCAIPARLRWGLILPTWIGTARWISASWT